MSSNARRFWLVDYVHLLGLAPRHEQVARLFLTGWAAPAIAEELGLTTRQVYRSRAAVLTKLRITGLGGLAQAVFAAVLREVSARLAAAGGPPLLAILEELRVEGLTESERGRRGPRRTLDRFRMEDAVHRVGLKSVRQRQAARRFLRDVPGKTGAHDLGIRPATFETHVRRAAGHAGFGNHGGSRRPTLVVELAEATFAVLVHDLADRLRSERWRGRVPRSFDLAAVLDDLRGEPPEDRGIGEARR